MLIEAVRFGQPFCFYLALHYVIWFRQFFPVASNVSSGYVWMFCCFFLLKRIAGNYRFSCHLFGKYYAENCEDGLNRNQYSLLKKGISMKKESLIIINLFLAILYFQLTTCVSEKKGAMELMGQEEKTLFIEDKNETIYKNEDFNLSVLFKKNDKSIFSSDKDLSHRIELKTGNGNPENPYVFGIEVNNHSDKTWTGVIKLSLFTSEKDARFFLPGYMYGNNNSASGLQPGLIKEFQRLRKGPVNEPFSPYWYMRSDQLTHPVAVMFNDRKILGISGSPYLTKADPITFWEPGIEGFAGYNGFYCSVETNAELGFTVGSLNYPGIYTSPWEYTGYDESRQGCVSIPAGTPVKFNIRIFAFKSEHEDGLGKVIENIYDLYHEKPLEKNQSGIREVAADICNAISKDAYSPLNNSYSLIMMKPMSFVRNKYEMKDHYDPGDYELNFEGLIGWTGGAVIAIPLLQASYRLNDGLLQTQAIKVIDGIVNESVNSATGIPYCTKVDGMWTNRGWWTPWIESEKVKPGHSSYIIGQSLYYILKAYELERAHGHEHTAWLSFVGKIIEIVSKTQDKNGAFPRFWDEDTAAGTEYDAFSGCWVSAALAYYIKLTSRKDLLPIVYKSEMHYYGDVVRMECSKTPLDVADAPDSEGILAYIRLTKLLSELAGDETGKGISYLDRMKTGIDYALSFTFCYNVPLLLPPLNKLHWSTCGGSITSVCNAAIHCMLNTILDEIHYYYTRTGNDYYGKRSADIYDWGLQVYNQYDCQFFFGKKGWSSEYFCQAERYVLDIRFFDDTRSNLWFAYHPWATAAVLEGICGRMWKE
jgi:hypothetical protein